MYLTNTIKESNPEETMSGINKNIRRERDEAKQHNKENQDNQWEKHRTKIKF